MRMVMWQTMILCASLVLAGCAHEPMPPMAKRVPTTVKLGGQDVAENYWWLRKKDDPAVIEYLHAENAYTDARMRSTTSLQGKLYDEMVGRIRETDEDVPHKVGDWWYSMRTEQGKQYPIYVRRHGSPDGPAEVIADVNQMAAGHPFFDYELGTVSDDGNLLAYATDVTGNRQYELQIKDLRTGNVLLDRIPLVDSFTWAAGGNSTLYYVKEDDSKRAYRVYQHELGQPIAADKLIYEEKDEEYSVEIYRTRDRKFIVLTCDSKTASDARVLPADGSGPLRLIDPRVKDREYYVDHRDGRFYIRVNDTGCNFRIVTAPDDHPGRENWSEFLPARDDVVLQDFDVFAHDLVLSERRDGLSQIAITPLPAHGDPAAAGPAKPREMTFDEPDYAVELHDNVEFNPPAIRMTYQSLTTPQQVIDLDLATGTQHLMKQRWVGGGFNRANYVEERLYATATDGTRIPISLVYRKGLGGHDGRNPLLLDGYGSYGMPEDVYFSSVRLSLLDRGVSFAIAHVRGGGEFGRAWYDAGRMANKPNTFSDFIASAEYLENQHYTSRENLAIQGGSAGGLLMGAVLNERPDLFRAAIAEVPWVDVLADMSDPSIPLTTLEYTEWGNPNIPAQRAVIASYDPVSNIHPQRYPAMLVRESINDSQVQYWDAARWVARLRFAKMHATPCDGKTELLLKMDMDAGHAGASGRYTELHEAAFDDAWLLTRLGIIK